MLLNCTSSSPFGAAAADQEPQYYRTCRPQIPILSDILNFLYLASVSSPSASTNQNTFFSESEIIEAVLNSDQEWTESEILRGLEIGVRRGLFIRDVPCNSSFSTFSGEENHYAFNPKAYQVNPSNFNYILPTASVPGNTTFAVGCNSISSRNWNSSKGFTTGDKSCCNFPQASNAPPTQTVSVPGVGTFTRTRPPGSFFCRNN